MKKLVSLFFLIIFFTLDFYAQSSLCDVISVKTLLEDRSDILYQKCFDSIPFEYEKFSLVDSYFWHPYQGFFNETFILTIPNGSVIGKDGWVIVDNKIINELVWRECFLSWNNFYQYKQKPTITTSGRIAVIAQFGYGYYHHWLLEVLGKLALLEIMGIEYDYLYVPQTKPYMKETLQLWGIPADKIITASEDYFIKASQLIVPSLVANATTNGVPRLVHYIPNHILQYIRTKLLKAIDKLEVNHNFAKRVFVSRKDAPVRRIINEDEIFALFEKEGFVRYELSKMSLIDSIILFRDADYIAGAVGSNLSNIIFCNDNTYIIDIFQAHSSCTIGYIAQQLKLKYKAVKTCDFNGDGHYDTHVPVHIIEKLLTEIGLTKKV